MTKVKIKNFQSVAQTEFEIEGFTVIVGKNNIGKSAIIRSIDAALTNRTGSDFIRHGEKQTEVSVEHEKLKIDWKKGGKASYKVNGESFSALNRGVPKPLTEAGFKRIELNSIKLNPLLAGQFNPLFLLDETGSVITEALSHIYNLDLPSRADDLCQKELKSAKNLQKIRKQDLEKVEEHLEVYKDFDKIKSAVEELSNLEDKHEALKAEIDKITEYESELQTLSKELTTLKPLLTVEIPDISHTKEKIEDIKQIYAWENDLIVLSKAIKSWKNSEEDLKRIDDFETILHNLQEFISSMNQLKKYHDDFRETALSAKEARDLLPSVQEELEKAEKEKAEIKACPLCKRPF